jgi:hypothetical protein
MKLRKKLIKRYQVNTVNSQNLWLRSWDKDNFIEVKLK